MVAVAQTGSSVLIVGDISSRLELELASFGLACAVAQNANDAVARMKTTRFPYVVVPPVLVDMGGIDFIHGVLRHFDSSIVLYGNGVEPSEVNALLRTGRVAHFPAHADGHVVADFLARRSGTPPPQRAPTSPPPLSGPIPGAPGVFNLTPGTPGASAAPHTTPQPSMSSFPPHTTPQPSMSSFPPHTTPQPSMSSFPPHTTPQPSMSTFPPHTARYLVAKGYEPRYEIGLEVLKSLPYRRWRDTDPEDTLRFHALRLHEVGMIKFTPQKLLAQNTDWRFLNELKKELKV